MSTKTRKPLTAKALSRRSPHRKPLVSAAAEVAAKATASNPKGVPRAKKEAATDVEKTGALSKVTGHQGRPFNPLALKHYLAVSKATEESPVRIPVPGDTENVDAFRSRIKNSIRRAIEKAELPTPKGTDVVTRIEGSKIALWMGEQTRGPKPKAATKAPARKPLPKRGAAK